MTRCTDAVTQGRDVVTGVGLGDGNEGWVAHEGMQGLGEGME